MKKLILALMMVAFASSGAMAHCGSCGVGEAAGEAKEEVMEKMKAKDEVVEEELVLTDEQKEELEVIKKTKEEAIQAAMDEYSEDIKEILTPEQLEKFEAMHGAHKHEMKGSH